MTITEQYLVKNPGREDEAVRTLISLPFLGEKLFGPLGLDANSSWFVLKMDKKCLCREFEGDIDVLAGVLEWNNPDELQTVFDEERRLRPDCPVPILQAITPRILAQKGGIKWPPSTDHLVAIEAKCCYLNPEASDVSRQNLKSTKTSKSDIKRLRAQVSELLEMGFDRVALLDIISNPPMAGINSDAWVSAFGLARLSRRAFDNDLRNRLPANLSAGHYVHSLGAVTGGLEMQRGVASVDELRSGIQNPLLSNDPKVQNHRAEVNENLRTALEALPAPRNFGVIFLDCQKCHRIHSVNESCK